MNCSLQVIDATASVSAEQFVWMKLFADQITTILPLKDFVDPDLLIPKARVGALMFQNEPKIVCSLTRDSGNYSNLVRSCQKADTPDAGPQAFKALEFCLATLAGADSAGSGRAGCVLLLTGGNVTDCGKLQVELLKRNVNFFIVAFLDPSAGPTQELQALTLKAQNLMFLPNFAEVQSLFSNTVPPSQAPLLELRTRGINHAHLAVTLAPGSGARETGELDWLQVDCLAPAKNEWSRCGTSQLPECSLPGLLAGTRYRFRARVREPGDAFTPW